MNVPNLAWLCTSMIVSKFFAILQANPILLGSRGVTMQICCNDYRSFMQSQETARKAISRVIPKSGIDPLEYATAPI